MNFFEKKTGGTTLYEGKVLTLTVDEVELPDGKKSERECVRHNGGAAVLYVENSKVLLVKQYRYLYGKEIYEIPAGKVEKGEDPRLAAERELEEEAGYKSAKTSHLLDIYPSPGYTDEVISIFKAENCKFVGRKPDEGEFVDCEFISLDMVLKLIAGGEICDAKTVAAVYKYCLEQK